MKKAHNTRICTFCKTSFQRQRWEGREWAVRKYCSRSCCNKEKMTPEIRAKISKSCKERGIGKWMEGRERPLHLRVRHSEVMRAIVASGKHNFWKGGIAQLTRSFKANFQNTLDYRIWRDAVFKRDNYSCRECGARNGNGKKIELNADHIKSFALFPHLRLAIDNGRTLCRECHYKRHSNAGLPSEAAQN